MLITVGACALMRESVGVAAALHRTRTKNKHGDCADALRWRAVAEMRLEVAQVVLVAMATAELAGFR